VGEAELFRAFALPARFGPARLAELMARDGVDAACGFSPRVYGSDYDAANRLILE
ncbi:MAG: hypothetical protein GWN54_05500, partial [Gammaproteobacteria bacterium]|nr:hypothetical protein [Gammaproteobacteria bacterium]NIV20083.1 hypothetical protein [Gammaproteobacteria bacterium]